MTTIAGVNYRLFDHFAEHVDEHDHLNSRQDWYEAISGMITKGIRPDSQMFFMAKAMLNSRMTNCPKAGHGSVIVRDKTVVSDGYNGVPRGYPHPESCGRMNLPSGASYSTCPVPCLHSETNAIFNAARLGARTDGALLYVTGEPCLNCSEAIVQAGISHLIFASGRPMPEHPGLRLMYGLGIEIHYMYYATTAGGFVFNMLECEKNPLT